MPTFNKPYEILLEDNVDRTIRILEPRYAEYDLIWRDHAKYQSRELVFTPNNTNVHLCSVICGVISYTAKHHLTYHPPTMLQYNENQTLFRYGRDCMRGKTLDSSVPGDVY